MLPKRQPVCQTFAALSESRGLRLHDKIGVDILKMQSALRDHVVDD